MKHILTMSMVVLLSVAMVACEEKGPAEKAGESIDNAVDDIKDSGKDLGNAIEDACEDVKEGAGADDTDC